MSSLSLLFSSLSVCMYTIVCQWCQRDVTGVVVMSAAVRRCCLSALTQKMFLIWFQKWNIFLLSFSFSYFSNWQINFCFDPNEEWSSSPPPSPHEQTPRSSPPPPPPLPSPRPPHQRGEWGKLFITSTTHTGEQLYVETHTSKCQCGHMTFPFCEGSLHSTQKRK